MQTNLCNQLFSEFVTQLKAMFWPAYTRTQRLGELYESRLFAQVEDGRGDKARWMDDQKFLPLGDGQGPPEIRQLAPAQQGAERVLRS